MLVTIVTTVGTVSGVRVAWIVSIVITVSIVPMVSVLPAVLILLVVLNVPIVTSVPIVPIVSIVTIVTVLSGKPIIGAMPLWRRSMFCRNEDCKAWNCHDSAGSCWHCGEALPAPRLCEVCGAVAHDTRVGGEGDREPGAGAGFRLTMPKHGVDL